MSTKRIVIDNLEKLTDEQFDKWWKRITKLQKFFPHKKLHLIRVKDQSKISYNEFWELFIKHCGHLFPDNSPNEILGALVNSDDLPIYWTGGVPKLKYLLSKMVKLEMIEQPIRPYDYFTIKAGMKLSKDEWKNARQTTAYPDIDDALEHLRVEL